jgi:hypothetical protein
MVCSSLGGSLVRCGPNRWQGDYNAPSVGSTAVLCAARYGAFADRNEIGYHPRGRNTP